jgi:hypothetical protein
MALQLIIEYAFEAGLTVLGAFIGAVVAVRVAHNAEIRRAINSTRYEFIVAAERQIEWIEGSQSLRAERSKHLEQLEAAMFKFRFHLNTEQQGRFDKAWRNYKKPGDNELRHEEKNGPGGGVQHDYTKARSLLICPLREMIKIAGED